MKTTLEMAFKLWTDDTGEHVYIGEDPDGFNCVEIRYVNSDGLTSSRITFSPKDAEAIADAIKAVGKHVTSRKPAP